MFAQTSTAMMSAPSCASRIAWLRPWPRAAPVMKATLPSSFPMTLRSSRIPARCARALIGRALGYQRSSPGDGCLVPGR